MLTPSFFVKEKNKTNQKPRCKFNQISLKNQFFSWSSVHFCRKAIDKVSLVSAQREYLDYLNCYISKGAIRQPNKWFIFIVLHTCYLAW